MSIGGVALNGSTVTPGTLGPSSNYPDAPTSYTMNPTESVYYIYLPDPGMPWDFAAMACAGISASGIHVILSTLSSDSLIYDVATKLRDNMSIGTRTYVEMGDEPWNWSGYPVGYWSGAVGQLCGYSDRFEFYVVRLGQIPDDISLCFRRSS